MDNRSEEKTALGLKESSKTHKKNIENAIDSASEDMQVRITEAEQKGKKPDDSIVMTYSKTIIFSGSELELKRVKKLWIKKSSQTLPGKHAYLLEKHSRAVMLTATSDHSQILETWETADVYMNKEAKERLESKVKKDENKDTQETIGKTPVK